MFVVLLLISLVTTLTGCSAFLSKLICNMSDVEKLIARLIDEHKITGEEAVTLIKSCNYTTQKTNSDL